MFLQHKRASALVQILLVSFSLFSTARAATDRQGVLIDSGFNIRLGQRVVEAREKVILDNDTNDWVTVSSKKQDVVVLARKIGGEGDVVEIEFQVVDKSNGQRRVLANPRVRTRIGERATTSLRLDSASDETVSVTVLPSRVHYQLD